MIEGNRETANDIKSLFLGKKKKNEKRRRRKRSKAFPKKNESKNR
jgi:hypothetical protein